MREPCSTYRIQCRSGVTLRHVIASVDYLHALGITDLYLSPIALARADSPHGYDVCDPNRIDEGVGSDADLAELAEALRARGMGLILDIVPNHQAADESRNAWWRDVLTGGRESPYARCFDVEWDPPNHALRNKVLLPVLDRPYGEALDAGDIQIARIDGQPVITYQSRQFPLIEVAAMPPGIPVSSEDVHFALEQQHYRLAHWRTATDDVNYRRFFNIEHLVGVRVEDEAVFDATHQWIAKLVAEGVVTGVRVDHPDGLAAPREYLQRLHRLADRPDSPLYVVVEKVLAGDETLPEDWPVHGTTGYEFLNLLSNLFVSRRELGRLQHGYARFVGWRTSFARTEYDSKRQVIETSFVSDLERLVRALREIADADLRTRDLTVAGLRRALAELTASLSTYRTYVDTHGPRPADLEVLKRAIDRVTERRTVGVSDEALHFIAATIMRPQPTCLELAFTQRWQQLTSAVFAKAVEDRAFYRDNLLLSMNEVGGDRSTRPGTDVARFHDANLERQRRYPCGMLATTTHDTKLSEDVRARIHLLTERADEWLSHVTSWRRMNDRHRRRTASGPAPDRHDEWRLYQLLIGLWPAGADTPPASLVERLEAAMVKAAREAARCTSWTTPNLEYEDATVGFIRRVLASEPFCESIAAFAQPIARAGLVNSLAQTILKVGSPGVPDFYQGTELCSLRMVDPDNRQAVDTKYRARVLEELRLNSVSEQARQVLVGRLLENWQDSAIKMFVTAEILRLRQQDGDLFTHGAYVPLYADGVDEGSGPEVVAFARHREGHAAIVVAPRFVTTAMVEGGWPVGSAAWKDASITLPRAVESRRFRDVMTGRTIEADGERLMIRDVLSQLPVAVAMAVSR